MKQKDEPKEFLSHLTDEQIVNLMLQSTGEDWYECDAWKLRMFVHNAIAGMKIDD